MAKILVIGPGALGAMLGAALQQRGHHVAFVGRGGPLAVDYTLDHGQQVGMSPGTGAYRFSAPDGTFCAGADLVLIAVKAFDLEQALCYSDQLPAEAPIVALGNGSVEGIVRAHAAVHQERTYRLGLVTVGISVGATQTAKQHYEIRSTAGKICFGAYLGPLAAATPCELQLTTADAIFAWEFDALSAHRRKWLYNTVINSICAAYRLPQNGELLSRQAEVDAVFDEAYALGEWHWGAWGYPRPDLYAGLMTLIQSTRANENSMARDRRLGVPTESEFLAGLAGANERFPRLNALHLAIMTGTPQPSTQQLVSS